MRDAYLIISDLQIPFHYKPALSLCLATLKEFRIPKANVICVGDEIDQYHGGQWPKSPNAMQTALQELDESIEILREWYSAFPAMRICDSNHRDRWDRKAAASQIPHRLMRPWREVTEAPKGWVWRKRWDINTRHPFTVIHGVGYSGQNATKQMVADYGRSIVHGHLHAGGGVHYVSTAAGTRWGMNSGCLINVDAYAFEYGRDNRLKPTLGLGVVVDNGRRPIFIPAGY